MRNFCKMKRCRGMSFIEVISCMVIVAFLCSTVAYVGSLSTSIAKEIEGYSTLRIYATDVLEHIQDDLEEGVQIDAYSYSEHSESSSVYSEVSITDVGESYGKSVYLVNMHLTIRGTNISAKVNAILREGCTLYARE